jgi:hypothetical protein
MTTALARLEECRDKIVAGQGTVQPGQPLAFTAACSPGDCICQGDVNLIVIDAVPDGYARPETPMRQIAKGNSRGSRHEIKDLTSCQVYLPPTWADMESLDGPVIVATRETVIDHPQHGAVTIPAGLCCRVEFQRNLDVVTRQERRARD